MPIKRLITVLLTLCLLCMQAAFATPAFALDIPRPVEKELVIIHVPNLRWTDIDPVATPVLYGLVGTSAVGNLSANTGAESGWFANNPRVRLVTLDATTRWEQQDSALAAALAQVGPEDTVIVVSAPAFVDAGATMSFTPLIICGDGYNGAATSSTTRRFAVVAITDLDLLARHITYLPDTPEFSNVTVECEAWPASADERLDRLYYDAQLCDGITETREPVSLVLLAILTLTLALSVLLLFLEINYHAVPLRILIPTVRVLWILVLAYPVSTLLMFALPPPLLEGSTLPLELMFLCAGWTLLLAFIALLIGFRTKWVNALFFLFILTFVVIIGDQLLYGPLTLTGYLNYASNEGVRYYGLGNEGAALLFGSWITLCGLLVNRFGDARFMPAFKRWGFLVASAAIIALCALPVFGAAFGVLTWGIVAVMVAWWLFDGRPVKPVFLLVVGLLAALLTMGTLAADLSFNESSHMLWVRPYLQEGIVPFVTAVVTEVMSRSRVTVVYSPVYTAAFVLLIIYLVVLALAKPGAYRLFWERNRGFRAAFAAGLAAMILMGLIEDSGIFMPALYLIFFMAGFVWLVCDLHSWRLRETAHGGEPLTLHELQLRDMEKAAAATPVGTPLPAIPAAAPVRSSLGRSVEDDRGAGGGNARPTGPDPVAGLAPSVGRSTALMSAATLLSRVTGFLRTWAFAFALGNTLLSSAYYVANNLPNMLYELVAGGVLTTAFLPLYMAQLKKHGKDGAAGYVSNLLSLGILVLGAVAFLATVFAPQVMFTQTFMTNGLDAALAVFFFRFFAVQMVFYGVGAIIGGLLNAHRSFLWPALGPVFNNIVVIITFFGFPLISKTSAFAGMAWLAVGTTVGVVAMFAVQVPALLRLKIPLRFKVNLRDPALKDTLRLAGPATVFIIMNLIVVSCMNAFSLNVTGNGPSTLSFAMLWYLLPYGVIGVALSTALFTEMSAASAAEDWPLFRSNVRMGLRTTIFLILPLAALMFALQGQLAGLFHAGQFTYDDVRNVAQVLSFWCLSLPFYAAYQYLYRAFSSLRDLNRFIAIDAVGRVLQITLYAFFTTGFGLMPGIGLIGIPLADAITYALLFFVMSVVLRRRIGSFGLEGILKDGARILIAAVLAAIPAALVARLGLDDTIAVSLAVVVACGLTGLVLFYLLCRLFKVPEITVVDTLLARLRRKKPADTGGA